MAEPEPSARVKSVSTVLVLERLIVNTARLPSTTVGLDIITVGGPLRSIRFVVTLPFVGLTIKFSKLPPAPGLIVTVKSSKGSEAGLANVGMLTVADDWPARIVTVATPV